MTRRLAIIGSGALASFFAARLAPWGDVVLVGGWQPQLAALARGVTLIGLDGSESQHRLVVTAAPARVAPAAVALVLVKSYQTAVAAARAAAVLEPDGLAVTLQNGLGNAAMLAGVLGESRVASGVVTLGATLVRPGVVRHAGQGAVTLATPSAGAERLDGLVQRLRQAGVETHVTADASGLVWGKLAINAGINPLTALLGIPNGRLAAVAALRRVAAAAAGEVATVAAARGVALPYADATAEMLRVAKLTGHNLSSMLQDLRQGRPTEIEAICGQVVAHGQEAGVATPVCRQLWFWVTQRSAGKEIDDWRIRLAGEAIDLAPYRQQARVGPEQA